MKKQITLVVGLVLIVFFIFFGRQLFQEGNPLPYLIGMVKIEAGDHSVVQVKNKPMSYLMKGKDYFTFIEEMKKEGWTFNQQMGSSFLFEKKERGIAFLSKTYSGKYVIMEQKKKK
ncbi:hypothetical protein [Priestia koreensis]|uniref:hypothetical protein n=1 Tax=Priestia koreensis TaxID=284581 RepID=UPI003018279C